MGYCESTVEDGHLDLCVWSRLPLVVLYYSLPLPALLPASISSVPTNTASVPPLLVDANTPCFRANTSTTSCAACLRLQFPRSSVDANTPPLLLHVRRAYAYGFSMRLQSVCGSSIYTLALFSYESTRCYLRFIIVGRTSFNQFSGFSMFSYPWPAPGDGDDYACAHAARCCCASVFGE